ncbi:hypothetical protein FC50_GL001260 [Lacticaseibacillus pantheris DSM 15945 = JCM 12539 = NBRC 106106]|uniref:Uncharacterized protein n=1 Tax=Lacticaseibacillus pantheris DSM 15945 = JCM 12539 = NBRC 106106 TaxID=1423783 RepID=A0A0R1TX51_9LACO|nr:hypothetical protein FC50_GL001260 [Lacticaseibacillus pantheris DSM 15945 = JCM 12539 = NBRC 106106]
MVFRTGLESRRKHARTWRVVAFALAVVTAEHPRKPEPTTSTNAAVTNHYR